MKTIIANPPFSASWDASIDKLQDARFKEYNKLAPKSKADYAFILDMIYKLDDYGIMSVVLPHGVLFRGGAEGHIRELLIKKNNFIDAVIGLPANLFYGTSIPTCILVFKKNRDVSDGIMFINASEHFEKEKNKNRLLDENINKICETYHNKQETVRYSRCVSLNEVEDNGYNLNISRYVSTFIEEPPIDIYEVMKEIKDLENQRDDLDREIAVYMKELGISPSFP